jgi:NADH:ubiquinone oxidoreductase subunit K
MAFIYLMIGTAVFAIAVAIMATIFVNRHTNHLETE